MEIKKDGESIIGKEVGYEINIGSKKIHKKDKPKIERKMKMKEEIITKGSLEAIEVT